MRKKQLKYPPLFSNLKWDYNQLSPKYLRNYRVCFGRNCRKRPKNVCWKNWEIVPPLSKPSEIQLRVNNESRDWNTHKTFEMRNYSTVSWNYYLYSRRNYIKLPKFPVTSHQMWGNVSSLRDLNARKQWERSHFYLRRFDVFRFSIVSIFFLLSDCFFLDQIALVYICAVVICCCTDGN